MKSISSRDNPHFKHLRALANDPRYRHEQAATVLDGTHLLMSALDAQVEPGCVAVTATACTQREVEMLLQRLPASCEVLELPEALLNAISPVQTPSGIVAEISIPSYSHMKECQDVLVLAGVQDAGNLGTMLRTAAASGVTHAWLDAHCAQVWSPKVLRAAMGAHFHLQIMARADLPSLLQSYAGQIAATVLSEQALSLYTLDLTSPTAWLFGSEGQGVPASLLPFTKINVIIPMQGGTESLNVAAAAAICLFEQQRQRLAK